MEISTVLLKLLVCPITNKPLIYDKKNKELISEFAGLAYPIIDGIPILLVDKARKISSTQHIFKNDENSDNGLVVSKSIEVA